MSGLMNTLFSSYFLFQIQLSAHKHCLAILVIIKGAMHRSLKSAYMVNIVNMHAAEHEYTLPPTVPGSRDSIGLITTTRMSKE